MIQNQLTQSAQRTTFKHVRLCSTTPEQTADDEQPSALSEKVEDLTLRYDVDTLLGKGRLTPRVVDVETSIKYMQSEGTLSLSHTMKYAK